jgi:hypothetical protein
VCSDLKYSTHFIDEITIATHADLDYHIQCVKTVLDRLTKVNLKINPDKLRLAQIKIYILGCMSGNYGLTLDTRKISNILDREKLPATSKRLSSMLGLANYFRGRIPNYSFLTAPIDKLRNVKKLTEV